MKPLLLVATLSTVLAPDPVDAAKRQCLEVIDGSTVRIEARRSFDDDLPTGDWIPLPSTSTIVECQIAPNGWLTDCRSPLADDRGRWIEKQLRLWKILDGHVGGCAVVGRRIRFAFDFDMAIPAVKVRTKLRIRQPTGPLPGAAPSG